MATESVLGIRPVGVERGQDKIEHRGDCHSQDHYSDRVPPLQPLHLDLGPVPT